MRKRVQLNEVPYEGIAVGERVMYLATHGKYTSMDFGFYRGMKGRTPVVEKFFRERKWDWNKERARYVQSNQWVVRSIRVFLYRGRVYGINQIKERLDSIPTSDDVARLIDSSPG